MQAPSTRSLSDMDSGLVEKLEENEAVAKSMLTNWLDKWQEAHDIMRVGLWFALYISWMWIFVLGGQHQ